MYRDLFGKTRLRVNTHLHTSLSDGQRTPAEAAALYKAEGYDIIAITDHWKYHEGGEISGLRILSGAEYNFGFNCTTGVYHILGLGCRRDPGVAPDCHPQDAVDAIVQAGGLVVLAHPSWSVNTPEQSSALKGLEATEIWNSVSNIGQSSRPYSGDFVDRAACLGTHYPLLAADDTHYFTADMDAFQGWIMVEGDETISDEALLEAIRDRKFYATQGPEVHIFREGDEAVVRCSPASRICFFSNAAWAQGHGHDGDGLTEARCRLQSYETFIRAEVTDAAGRRAWTNILPL